jgi:pimeloyl-ACP methyl ester carboxylesterase
MDITAASSWQGELRNRFGGSFELSIDSVNGAPIDSSVPTWLVVHGFNSEPGTLTNVISAVQRQLATLPGNNPFQILTLDWSSGAGNPLTVEDLVPLVAEWVFGQLTSHQMKGSSLNLIGHSFGSYIADELAELFWAGGSKVNSLVALDPAAEIPVVGSYDASDSVNFARHSRWSWSFIDGGTVDFNNAATAATAHEAFVLEDVGSWDPLSSHREVRNLFANLLDRGYRDFRIAELLDDQPGPWEQNRYDPSGNPVVQGAFEALIDVVSSNNPGIVEFLGRESGVRTRLHTGTPGADRLIGDAGVDMLDGLAGNDLLDGAGGIDVGRYGGVRQNHIITSTSGAFTVSGLEGLDTVMNVERLYFEDTKVALDLNGAAGNAAKIIGAAFGPAYLANREYVGTGVRLFDSGTSMNNVAALVVDSVPFRQLTGSSDDAAVVTQIYRNVVGAAPAAADLNYFLGLLGDGMSRGELLVLAANSELNQQNIDLVGLSQSGIEYV